jgi:C4-dicarboxylate-specific signal transduction histidine kinase
VAIAMYCGGLFLADQLPSTRRQVLLLVARALALVFTVYLANHMTTNLRRQQRRLIRQNKKIRRIGRQLRRHQDALVQHEKMVALGQMAAGVAHEITNPLASMDSVLQLLKRKPERLRPDIIETLREQAQRIERVIKQMKAFAHPVDSQVQTLPLNDIVERAIALVQFDKRVKRVPVEQQLATDVGQVSLLPQALEQVLINLISNALDAVSEVEQPRVIVRTERAPDGACHVEVIDNGHGILPQHMRRLFEPFFTTKPVGKGTGLGLSISYSLMQRIGGGIAARSTPGRGTTFTVALPRQAAAGHSQSREARLATSCNA